jgi:glutamyl-tRNA synthetase
MKERATFPKDIYENGKFFFEAPLLMMKKHLKKHGMMKLLQF